MKAAITLTGRKNPIMAGYRPTFRIGPIHSDCQLTGFSKINVGETGNVNITLLLPERFSSLKIGDKFILTEGLKEVANGIIIR